MTGEADDDVNGIFSTKPFGEGFGVEHIYCLVCGTGREKPQVNLSVLRNFFLNFFLAQLVFWLFLYLFSISIAILLSTVFFIFGFLAYEFFRYQDFKNSLKCPICQFNLTHYKTLSEDEKKSYLKNLMQDGETTWKRWYQALNQSISEGSKA